MKYWMSLVLLAFALGGGSAMAQVNDDSDFWENNDEYWTDEDLSMFETDNWVEDDFGMYDDDFTWETEENEEFDEWYENAHNDWTGYDDAGEAGWFDV